MTRTILAVALILASASSRSGRQEVRQGDGRPRGHPAGTRHHRQEPKYPHDLIGFATSAEYREAIDAVAKGKKKLPRPPFVDLAVEIKNTSDKAVKVWAKGDPVVLTLNLKGKGR